MKRLVLSLLLILLPMNLLADDHCTNPKEYTVDNRCYVTYAQKKQKPYNAVVGVLLGYGQCTGTIVKAKDGKPYLYTAKHCTDINGDGRSDKTLRIKLQDGRILIVTRKRTGYYDIKNDENLDGDWAIYSIDETNVPMVEIGVVRLGNIRVVGYGALKIMSDKEIADFKHRYAEFLKKELFLEDVDTAFVEKIMLNTGVNLDSVLGRKFKKNLESDLFDDNYRLKESKCVVVGDFEISCQTWGGNSGGPLFDDHNNIIGIHTRGYWYIGGDSSHHARGADFVDVERNPSSIFESLIKFIEE